MHEVSLYSQIARNRHDSLLKTLAGIVGAPPTAYTQQHVLVSKDRVVHDLHREVDIQRDLSKALGRWELRIAGVPEPGSPETIFRNVKEHSLEKLADYDSDNVVGHHYVAGSRLVHGNVVLRIFRIFSTVVSFSTAESLLAGAPCTLDQLTHADPSGTYVAEATTRLEDGNDLKYADLARKELLAFKEQLSGVITFQVPDRFALDTRVKGV